jgi:hypothetical protein
LVRDGLSAIACILHNSRDPLQASNESIMCIADSPELPKSKLDERGQPGLQIRCVLATGAEDQKIQVFAFQANDRSHE